MNNTLIIVPSRKRQSRIDYFYEHFKTNSLKSDIVFVLDDDDDDYPVYEDAMYEVLPRDTVPNKINIAAMKYIDDYKYIGFLGDDHVPKTYGWDHLLTKDLNPVGIGYGNDLIQGPALPTVCIMSSNIPKTLGYVAVPTFKHFYIDNVWKDWGMALNRLFYYNDVIIEHYHWSVNKSDKDITYSNTDSFVDHDYKNYLLYSNIKFKDDVLKLKELL